MENLIFGGKGGMGDLFFGPRHKALSGRLQTKSWWELRNALLPGREFGLPEAELRYEDEEIGLVHAHQPVTAHDPSHNGHTAS
jgi:hypothetical protein